MDWAKSPESREQLVLFQTRLDDAIPQDHVVRLLDDFLQGLDWSKWEATYDLRRGQPPIHPRILASVILYGLLKRIRSSRALEEALSVRLDFRWLVEGRTIDHTTISEFRRKRGEALKDTFVQVGLAAREMGWLPLETLAFDGTRIRANNRQRGAKTREQLREMKKELAARFAELEARIAKQDSQEDEVFGEAPSHALPAELADVERRREQVDAALAELQRMEQAEETIPERLPLTDPQSRVLPNKEGGFAPNYTPLATVDADSGLIVSADVISDTAEDKHLIASIEDVQQQFGGGESPPAVLADGMMATGDNLAECADRGIDLYAPLMGSQQFDANSALRDDPTQPVPASERENLPTKVVAQGDDECERLDKQAFVYDPDKDCYWCPEGKPLSYKTTSRERRKGKLRERRRYQASTADCTECPLRSLCLGGRTKRRTLYREKHEAHRESHTKKMSTDAAKTKYSRRAAAAERPFAVTKHQFGARRFLLRGLQKVKQEWRWLAIAFNLQRLMGLLKSGAGPPGAGRSTVI